MALTFASLLQTTSPFSTNSIKISVLGTSLKAAKKLTKHTAQFKCNGVAGELSMSEPADKWVQFPHLCDSGRRLMEEVASMIETQLDSQLNPCCTPADVRSFKNADVDSEGSVNIKSGAQGSKIDFVLGSWLHCKTPFGVLNIATIIGMVNPQTDAPHLLFEFIQSGQSSLVLVLDLLPRKDLVLDPDYLKWFYEDTKLDAPREALYKAQQAQPYVSSSLYVRSIVSPTAILVKINSELQSTAGTADGMEKIINDVVEPAAKEVVRIWLDAILTRGRPVDDFEKDLLLKRDNMIKTKGVEVDLSSNMPRLFGQDVTDRVVAAFRKGI
ncbi:hypothetical protein SUGI_0191940 [Cryptomeria japonica]|uniref:red chlorophyll catabolite reductase n=1 Tax=Cryptomeria japonica TaxID=3369 RepID=UPI002408CC98|nr:red chlorophyll catabolite reductase [Cryptomeria japonica]GLJ12486.1 hypothetical protein SUGI_0191940 [Cryptomeria japonica]